MTPMTKITRTDPPYNGSERAILEAFLDYHRDTLAIKCQGLTDEHLRQCSVPPSNLSLLGLVRHLAEVERHWFQRVLGGEDTTPIYYTEEHPDGDLEVIGQDDTEQNLATWRAECDRSREITAGLSLDSTGRHRDNDVSLCWVLAHMIEEYARHNGHADLIREAVDGAVGE